MDVETVKRCHMCKVIVGLFFLAFGFVLGGLLVDAMRLSGNALVPSPEWSELAIAWWSFFICFLLIIACAIVCVAFVLCDQKVTQMDEKLEKYCSMNALEKRKESDIEL